MEFAPQPLVFFPVFIIAAINIFISSYVFLKNRKSILRLMFFLLCLSVSLWALFISFMSLGISASLMSFNFKAAGWAGAFIPLFFLLFCAMFPEEKLPFSKTIFFLICIPSAIMIILSPNDLLLNNLPIGPSEIRLRLGALALPYLLYFVLYFGLGGSYLYRKFKKAEGLTRTQFEYFFLGLFLTSTLGALCNVILVYFKVGSFVYIGPFWTFLLVGFTAYAITKEELMDIRVVISRGLSYGISGVLLIASFIGLNALRMPISLAMTTNALLALFWAWGAHRLREFIQTPLEEKWITRWYDSNKLIAEITSKLAPAYKRDQVLKIIADELKGRIKIKSVDIIVNGEKKYPLLTNWVRGKKDLLHYENAPNEVKKELNLQRNSIILPLCSSVSTEGIMVLGPKISEDPYDEKDFILFRIIINQSLIIFDRVRPYEQIKAELEEAARVMERSQRLAALGTLTAGVTHEIRNPMTLIRGKMETLFNKPRDETYLKDTQKIILENCDRIESIIQGMLGIAREKKEKREIEVNLNEIIEKAIGFFPISRIRLVKELKPIPAIKGDPNELREMFVNLVQNAIEAMPEDGTLTVKSFPENGHVVAEVSDTGAGIPEELRERIFDPFFSTHHEGVGLGLSIVYRIVREHGGDVKVKSEVGKGTTFKILF